MRQETIIGTATAAIGLGSAIWITTVNAKRHRKTLAKLDVMDEKWSNLQQVILARELVDVRAKLMSQDPNMSPEEKTLYTDLLKKVQDTMDGLKKTDLKVETETKVKSDDLEFELKKDDKVDPVILKDELKTPTKSKVKETEVEETEVSQNLVTRAVNRSEGSNIDVEHLLNSIGTASKDDADDLKAITGIGPSYEERLNNIGIYTYNQISKLTAPNVALLSMYEGISRDKEEIKNWVKQSKVLLKKDKI